jgi:chromosome segregation ATPase
MRRPIRILGLVRGRSYDALAEQQKKAEARASQLAQQLEKTRADSRLWKTKAEEATDALKKAHEAADTAQRQMRLAEKLKDEAIKNRGLEQERTADLALLQQRLADSERELSIAREQLMAIEVKLDILEGAANVLDGRTRDVMARRSAVTERGTSV